MVKVLIVLTSQKETTWGKDTGYWLEELAAPFLVFADAGLEVEIASVLGGSPPVDAGSLAEGMLTEDTRRFGENKDAQSKLSHTKPVQELVGSAGSYAAVFLAGGHGAAIDMPESAALKRLLEDCHTAGGVVSAVCHGCCGLVRVTDSHSGEPLVKGRRVAGFSDEEEAAVGLVGKVPFSLEGELKRLGGAYESGPAWGPFVVSDGKLVTGQNPGSSKKVALEVLKVIANKA